MPSIITHMMSIWNAAALLLVLAMTIIALVRWKSLPQQIPLHYDLEGRPEAWAGRRGVWFYPILALAVIAIIAADGEKASPLGLFVVATVFFGMLRALAIADGRADRLPPWFMPVSTFGMVLLVLFIYLR